MYKWNLGFGALFILISNFVLGQNTTSTDYYDIKFKDPIEKYIIKDFPQRLKYRGFQAIYSGEIKDTISIYFPLLETGLIVKEKVDGILVYNSNEKFPLPKKKQMEIFVDTTRQILELLEMPSIKDRLSFDNNEKIFTKYDGILSYPVFIKSLSQDLINIGFADELYLTLEAMNENGEWKTLRSNRVICGTGTTGIYLKPSNIILTTCPIYKGNFETKLRLIYNSNEEIKSNEFTGKINKSDLI